MAPATYCLAATRTSSKHVNTNTAHLSICLSIHTYIHTYIHMYIHTYIHTYAHALRCIALHYITLHYIHYTTSRYTTPHYTTLHYTYTYPTRPYPTRPYPTRPTRPDPTRPDPTRYPTLAYPTHTYIHAQTYIFIYTHSPVVDGPNTLERPTRMPIGFCVSKVRAKHTFSFSQKKASIKSACFLSNTLSVTLAMVSRIGD